MRYEGIDVYCECIVENDSDNMNMIEESVGATYLEGENSVVGEAHPLLHYLGLENDGPDGEYLLEVESSWNCSDYDVIISNEDDEFEQVVNSKKRRSAQVEREICHLWEHNKRELDNEGISYCIQCVSLL